MRIVPAVATTGTNQRAELRARADRIVAELTRLTDDWRAGSSPSHAELYALAEEVGELRSALGQADDALGGPPAA
jgi:hypothetical protein